VLVGLAPLSATRANIKSKTDPNTGGAKNPNNNRYVLTVTSNHIALRISGQMHAWRALYPTACAG